MAQFLNNLLTASIHGSIVILAVIILRLLLRKTPKKFICLLWLLAGIRLLMPIKIHSDLSLQPSFVLPALKWATVLPWIWGAVACGFGIYSIASYIKLKQQVREAVRIRGGWECDKIDTAFILGFIKPQIYIPMGMNNQSRKHILEHERTHLDKGDHWIKMIGFLALALHWFNPLVWVAYIMLCKDIELACDERVVQFMELDERKSYSAALLSCSSRKIHYGACPVAFGEVSVKQRILSILNYKKPGFWISLLGVVAFFFVAICLLTNPTETGIPVETLTPEQQEEQNLLQDCFEDVEQALAQEEFFYEGMGVLASGEVRWVVRLYRIGEDTMWTFTPSTSPDVTEGRLHRNGKDYAWQSGNWVETDTVDDRFEEWLNVFRWDLATSEFVSKDEYDNGIGIVFTSRWKGEDKTEHTATVTCSYSAGGKLQNIMIDQPNYENVDSVHLQLEPITNIIGENKTVSEFFEDADAATATGFVSEEEMQAQAEYDKWGVFFRVDDDLLSSMGADVGFIQDEFGRGVISTTEEYWIERKVNGAWEKVPMIGTPNWSLEIIGVAKNMSTYGYLDWSPLYGQLEPGEYRMGKVFECYDWETDYSKSHTFYSEFSVYEKVDSDSPEAKAAVERCYAELEELKQREYLHWRSELGRQQFECWVNGNDYLEIVHFDGPEYPYEEWSEHDKNLFPRTDTTVRYDDVLYVEAREDPNIANSKVLGMGVSSLDPYRNSWDNKLFADDFCVSFFERGNFTISFPEGIGVISDEMVRFVASYTIATGEESSHQITYQFDKNGNLCYMEAKYDSDDGGSYSYTIEIFADSPEEIDAKIKTYTEDLVVSSFSWEEAKAKYTDEEFNIREDKFVNTEESPITGPVDAARLALKEYPNLEKYLSLDVCHDDAAGIWKVTIEAYADYQSTYEYRDVYLTDNGITQLLVFEGPIQCWDDARK